MRKSADRSTTTERPRNGSRVCADDRCGRAENTTSLPAAAASSTEASVPPATDASPRGESSGTASATGAPARELEASSSVSTSGCSASRRASVAPA